MTPQEQRDHDRKEKDASRERARKFAEQAKADAESYRGDWSKHRSATGPGPTSPPKDFVKHDSDKPRPELIPPGFVMLLGEVFAYGAKKYDDDNWRKCPDARRYVGAALRHLYAFAEGETNDPESGLHHLGHAGASIAMLWGLTEDDNAS